MNKEFAPYEQALALKELEFDEPCLGYYIDNKFEFFADVRSCNTNSEFGFYPTAPTYQQAFRWFREKHNIEGFIVPLISERKGISFEERVYEALIIFKGNKKIKPGFKTYEEAELDCLKKLIEIVKNK
jgi:hypothetical protein